MQSKKKKDKVKKQKRLSEKPLLANYFNKRVNYFLIQTSDCLIVCEAGGLPKYYLNHKNWIYQVLFIRYFVIICLIRSASMR